MLLFLQQQLCIGASFGGSCRSMRAIHLVVNELLKQMLTEVSFITAKTLAVFANRHVEEPSISWPCHGAMSRCFSNDDVLAFFSIIKDICQLLLRTLIMSQEEQCVSQVASCQMVMSFPFGLAFGVMSTCFHRVCSTRAPLARDDRIEMKCLRLRSDQTKVKS